jgi:hypothetical protein
MPQTSRPTEHRVGRRRRRLARAGTALAGVAALSAAACSSGGRIAGIGGGSGLILGTPGFVVLRTSSSCDDLLARLREEAAKRVTAYGFGGGGVNYATDGMLLEGRATSGPATTAAASRDANSTAASSPAKNAAGSASAPDGSFSTTNVQEQGVDEPDLVKTDGTRAFVVGGGQLRVLALGTGQPTLLASTALDNISPNDLLLAGDRLLVFGYDSLPTDIAPGGGGKGVMPPAAPGIAIDIAGPMTQRSTITEVDVSDPTRPAVGRTLSIDGQIVTSRLVDHTARVVVRSYPQNLPFVYPQNPSGEARAKASNVEVVRQSTLEDWLPSFELRGAAGAKVDAGPLAACSRVETPTDFAGFGTVSILTFDINEALGNGDAVSVMAGAEHVYASDHNLFVATTRYDDDIDGGSGVRGAREPSASYNTSIHQFDISGTGPANYVASGGVDGHLLDQFAMSEHDGVLRVASTKGPPWGNGTESGVSVLKRTDTALAQIGYVGGMGKGERLYSVRFAGTKGYAVTFRQTDPFYTLDLTDPTNPRVVGELKIPGFSSYLHPIGGDLVIGVGQEGSGAKVSVFDVHDPSAPVEVAKWTLPNSQNTAGWDHHAFLFWPDAAKPGVGQIILPVQEWGAVKCAANADCQQGFFGVVVLKLDGKTLTEQGRISHPVEDTTQGECPPDARCMFGYGGSTIQRSFVATGVLWTVADRYLQANDLGSLAVRGGVGW